MENNQAGAFGQVFRDQQLSVGLSLPMLQAGQTIADFHEQLSLARLADTLGFRALWVRDVPLNSADYPDPVGHLDPWVFLGALAAQTERIALASGAIVLTLRHPLHIAKGAISTNALSGDRFSAWAPATGLRSTPRSARTPRKGGNCSGATGQSWPRRPACPPGSCLTWPMRRTSSCCRPHPAPFRCWP